MLETLLAVLITGIVGLVAFLVIFARWHYGSLEKLGIPVAKPHFILGSDPDGHKIVYQERDLERFKQYGPVFGVMFNAFCLNKQIFVNDRKISYLI